MQKPAESKPRKPKGKKKKPATRAPLPPSAAKPAASKQPVATVQPALTPAKLALLLYQAVFAGRDKEVKQWLDAGADANAVVGDRFTLENKHSLLYLAAYKGFDKVVELLLAKKADVDAAAIDGSTPLHAASQQNHPKVVALLLAAAANFNKQDNDGEIPLYIASGIGSDEIVAQLLARQAQVNTPRRTGVTPLFIACQGGYLSVVKSLLVAGADLQIARTADHMTALHVAAHAGHAHVALMLVIHGADPDKKNRNGESARDYARVQMHEGVLAALQGYQAFFIYNINELCIAYAILCIPDTAEHRWLTKLKSTIKDKAAEQGDDAFNALNIFLNNKTDADYIEAQNDVKQLRQNVIHYMNEYKEHKTIVAKIAAEKLVQPATAAILSMHFKSAALPVEAKEAQTTLLPPKSFNT